MSVYKPKGSKYWHFDYQFKRDRFYGSTGATTRRKAETVESAHREARALEFARAASGQERPREALPVPTLDQAAQEWWEGHGKALGRPETLQQREDALALAVNLVGPGLLVTQIRTDDIAKAIAKRRGLLVRGKTLAANATVNGTVIAIIRPIVRRACKLLEVSPPPIDWQALTLPLPKPKPRDFKAEDLTRIDAALPGHWVDFARLERRYAIRLEEMFFLPSDIDVEGKRLHLRDRKGGDDHVVPLVDEDVAMLAGRKSQAEAAKLATVWFRVLKRGRLKALTYNGAKQAIRRVMRATGLHESQRARGSHDFRRHGAITILRSSGNLMLAKKLLGHANIQSTMVYADAVEDDLRAALVAMSRTIPEATQADANKDEEKQAAS